LRVERDITAPRCKIRDIALFEEIKKALEMGFFLFKNVIENEYLS